MREERDEWTGEVLRMPETVLERIAWALCAHDCMAGEGYLNDEELAGLEMLIQKMDRTVPPDAQSRATWLGVPPAAIQRHMLPLIRLARVERSRRGEGGLTPHSRMKLVRAFWPDYMKHAEVAWSVLVERPEAALATGRDQAAKDGDDHARL